MIILLISFVGIACSILAITRPFFFLLSILLFRGVIEYFNEMTLIPIGTTYININALFALIIICAGSSFILVKKINIFDLPLVKSFALLLSAIVCSLPLSTSYIISISDILRLFSVFIFYILLSYHINSSIQINRILSIFVLSSLFPVVLASYQYFSKTGLQDFRYNRLMGPFAHPNVLGLILIILIPLTFVFFHHIRDIRIKWIGFLYCLWMIFILFQTYTRASVIGMAIVGIIFGIFKNRKFLIYTIAFLLLIVLVFPEFLDRFLINEKSFSSINTRLITWNASINYFQQNPILGWGYGTFSTVNRQHGLTIQAHNDFIRIIVETGLVGFFCYLFFILNILKKLLQNIKNKNNEPSFLNIKYVGLAIFIAYLAVSFVSNPFGYTVIMWYLFCLIALTNYNMESTKEI